MRFVPVLLALGLAACAGVKTYPNDAAKNLTVRSTLDAKVKASLHVHQVDAKCQTEYQGGLALDQPMLDVGLPAERPSYLVVLFDTSSFLGGSRSTSVGTLVTPRKGYSYDLVVAYRDSVYNVALRETDRKGASRELARRDIRSCSAS